MSVAKIEITILVAPAESYNEEAVDRLVRRVRARRAGEARDREDRMARAAGLTIRAAHDLDLMGTEDPPARRRRPRVRG